MHASDLSETATLILRRAGADLDDLIHILEAERGAVMHAVYRPDGSLLHALFSFGGIKGASVASRGNAARDWARRVLAEEGVS